MSWSQLARGCWFQFVPWPESTSDDDKVFALYDASLTAERERDDDSDQDGIEDDLLDAAWHVLQLEEERRSSIVGRAAGTLGTVGVIVAVLLAVSGSVTTAAEGLTDLWRIATTVLVAAAVAYFIVAVCFAISLQQPRKRFTVGPTDVLPLPLEERHPSLPYRRQIATTVIEMTAKNYRVNNRQNSYLRAANVAVRNAIMCVTAAAVVLLGFGSAPPAPPAIECSIHVDATTSAATLSALLDLTENCNEE